MLAKLWARLVTLAKTDPALVMSVVQSALAAAVTLGFSLSAAKTGAIEGAVTAALGLIVAAYTRPFRTGAATALVSAAGTVLLSWKVPGISPGLVSVVNVLATGLLMLAVTSPQTASLAVIRARQPAPQHAAPRL
jgi:hypothetical protein